VIFAISRDWTAEDRLQVIAALLPDLQADIYAGRYSAPGRPNITTIQGLLTEPPEVLEADREAYEAALLKWEMGEGEQRQK